MTLTFLFAYNSLIRMDLLPKGISASVHHIAVAKATVYMRRTSAPVLAVTGTSKAAFVQEKYFAVDTVNLGIPGGVVLTGLTILDRSKQTPKVVLVEINSFSVRAPAAPEVVQLLDSPPSWLAELLNDRRYRPAEVLLGWSNERIGPIERKAQRKFKQLVRRTHPKPMVQYSQTIGTNLKENCRQIEQIIARLEKRGCKVILFEVPTDTSNTEVSASRVDKFLHAYFPHTQYTWLPRPAGKFETVDNIHLTDASAARFARSIQNDLVQRSYITVRRSMLAEAEASRAR